MINVYKYFMLRSMNNFKQLFCIMVWFVVGIMEDLFYWLFKLLYIIVEFFRDKLSIWLFRILIDCFFIITLLFKSLLYDAKPKFNDFADKKCFFDKDSNTKYIRVFALWNCIKCKRRWFSAYTWLSLEFVKKNVELYKFKKKKTKENTNINKNCFSGINLKDKDILQQHCQKCHNKKNKVIYYFELSKSNKTEDDLPHRSNLCVKCLKGYPCKDNN